MKKVLPILVALILAAIAALGIINYSRGLNAGAQTIPVMVAARPLEPGATIRADDIQNGTVRAPVTSQQDAAVWDYVFEDFVDPSNRGTLEGRVTERMIGVGQPIMLSMLEPIRRERMQMDWKTKIPADRRAVALPVSGEGAVNGLVEVGDKVDVLVTIDVPSDDESNAPRTVRVPVRMGDATQQIEMPMSGNEDMEPMTFYLLQNVEVLSVGSQIYRLDEIDEDDPLAMMGARSGRAQGITVALSPEQALMVAFVIEGGNADFTLALRTPGDESLFDTVNNPPADFDELLTMVGYTP